MQLVRTRRWWLLLLAFMMLAPISYAQTPPSGFPDVSPTGFLPRANRAVLPVTLQDETTLGYFGEYDAVENLTADVPAILLRFQAPLNGEVSLASFLLYNGILLDGDFAEGITGTGTLRLQLFEAPDLNAAPALTDSDIAAFDVDFANLQAVAEQPTDLPNDIDLSGQGFAVTADQSYYLMLQLVDASPDAALTFVIDEGSVDATDGNYYPARTLTYRRGAALPAGGQEGYYRYQGTNANVVVELIIEGTVGGMLAAPVLNTPQEGAMEVSTSPVFAWSGVDTAVEYQIQIASNMEFTMPEFDETVSSTTFNGATLQPMTAYFWRVRALDASGNNGPFSTAARFTTALVTALEPNDGGIPHAFALEQNYPNPFNSATTLAFALPTGEPVKLSVYDLLGKEVAVLVNERLAPGRYTFGWDATGQASGVYLYRLEAGPHTAVRRMTLTR